MSLVLHTLCVMSCIVSLIYCVVVYYFFNDTKRFLWYTGSYIFFVLNSGSLYAIFPYKLFEPGVDDFAANFFFATYVIIALFMSFSCIYLLQCPYPKLTRFMTGFGYYCVVLAACIIAIPESHFPAAYVVVSLTGMVPTAVAMYLANQFANQSRQFLLPVISYVFMLLASVLDPVLALTGYKGYGFRIFALSLFALTNSIIFAIQYKESIAHTDSLSMALTETLEKIRHSDNALMCTRMNPDFLYSSLALIRQKCDDDAFTAEELTVSLSKYLRHTLGFKQLQGFVTISNEIELTKAYIAIEKVRNPRINFELSIPDDLPDFNIPPLSIQPLVENSIEHAFKGNTSDPRIAITVLALDENYHISVTDNGCGMTEEDISKATADATSNTKVGLFNIHARLLGLYGKGVQIVSTDGLGTSVSFDVPIQALYASKEVANE
ncbi:MAG: histidine kinase [Lachnospiraceae bacterium]|nr:histidine kinase [Lachnospiraceae bacterium]